MAANGWNGNGNSKLSSVGTCTLQSWVLFLLLYYFIGIASDAASRFYGSLFDRFQGHKFCEFKRTRASSQRSYHINIDQDHLLLLGNECALLELNKVSRIIRKRPSGIQTVIIYKLSTLMCSLTVIIICKITEKYLLTKNREAENKRNDRSQK